MKENFRNKDLLKSATNRNCYVLELPWKRSTLIGAGVFANQENDRCDLGKAFLLNSYFSKNNKEEIQAAAAFMDPPGQFLIGVCDSRLPTKALQMPRGTYLQGSLASVLHNRKSTRIYSGDYITLEDTATLLRAGQCITGQLIPDGEDLLPIRTRSAPSPGGLYAVDIYLAVQNIKGLERGVYRYDPIHDCLESVRNELEKEDYLNLLSWNEEIVNVSRSACAILLVGKPTRTCAKYGVRGIRYMFFEAGCISQNICLAATSLSVGAVNYVSVQDAKVHSLVGADGVNQCFISSIILGSIV